VINVAMSKKKLLKKHKSLKEKGGPIKATKNMEKAKQDFNVDQAEVLRNLTDYLKIKDPLIWDGKVIALIRRPSMKELKELIPPDLRQYVNDPNGLPPEKAAEYESFFYEKMAEFIVVPKKDSKGWEATANPWFIRLFFDHLRQIAQLLEGNVEGF